MSITTFIAWLTVALNPFMTSEAGYDPVFDDAEQQLYTADREPTSGGCDGEEEDEDEREEVKPFNPAFFISNGF